ncbi:MAG: hypothetical protein E7E25_08465 [Fusobacterium periodonticum]|jgi:hypothetical protein|nr:hypothetical protein [Fusobacterium periodonticum]
MVRYNIEVKYLCFGKEHTSEVYYNALDNLNEEEKESVLQGYLDIVKTYKGFEGFLESYIWKDREEKSLINLNKLKNYKSIAYATHLAQLEKVKEEFNELKRNYMKGIFLIVMHEAFLENEGKND